MAVATDEYFEVPDLAARWGLGKPAVRQLIASKRLTAIKIGRKWLVHPDDLAAYELARRNVPPVRHRRRK